MYCPVCLNDGLKINSKGILKLSFNGKQKDSSKVLYNLKKETTEQVYGNIKDKMEEFFKWYSTFNNKETIENVEIFTLDLTCTSKNCAMPFNSKISMIGMIIDQKKVKEFTEELGKKYNIKTNIKG